MYLLVWPFDSERNLEGFFSINKYSGQVIKVITKLPNSEQSYKGKVKTHNYINRHFLPLLRRFNPAEPVVEKSVIL